ncbi:MAG TPA: hypothetical protein VM143_00075 [Acidimicrobiales bacterium]|nr:hypothetical protein [Acidimicrobiales bacterium]
MVVVNQPSRHHHAPRRNGRDSADGQVLGAVLVLGGIGWFVQQIGLLHLSVATMLSCLLIVLGVGLVVTARRAGGSGLILVGIALTVVLASASAVDVGVLQKGVGERTFVPATKADLLDGYELGVGSLTLDLRAVDAADLAGRKIDVRVGVGELVVLLPQRSELAVDVRAGARAGEVDLFSSTRIGNNTNGNSNDGTNVTDWFFDADAPPAERLDLDLDVGLGTVEVVRPPSG